MQADVTKKLFNVDDYYRMAEAGILGPCDRVELIEGEIIEMSPIGLKHAAYVDRATDLFTLHLRAKAIVSIQNPLRLNEYNEPQPDIVVLKRRADYYASQSRFPKDTFFVVEVSDTSLRFDVNVKLPLYATHGVQEVWIENLQDDVLLVNRDPAGKEYKTRLTLRRGESVSPAAFPDVVFQVTDLLG